MESTITSAGTSWHCVVCKYRMPCGYCELKKENCNFLSTVSTPIEDYKKWAITPTWTPNLNEVTCEDGQWRIGG